MERKLELALKKIEETGRISLKAPATKEEIDAFKKTNEVCLPEQLSEWLMISDGGDLLLPAGVQLYGVSHKPFIEMDERVIPKDRGIVIGAMANGDPVVCFFEDGRVAIYDNEAGCFDEDEVFPCLEDFFDKIPALC